MSMQQLCCLSLIAKSGTNGVTTADMTAVIDTCLTSIQRQLDRLGKGYSYPSKSGNKEKEVEGLELIEKFENPLHRKQNRWVLSEKGVKIFKQLNSVI